MPLPPYTAVVTFDGGYQNNATVALPCLREAGITACFFLFHSLIGTDECHWTDQLEKFLNDDERDHVSIRFEHLNSDIPLKTTADRREALRLVRWLCRRMTDVERKAWLDTFFTENKADPPKATGDYRLMNWVQVKELHAAGMTIGTLAPPSLLQSEVRPETAESQIIKARDACERELRSRCDALAYPRGTSRGIIEAGRDHLRRCGISCALTTSFGLNNPNDDLYALKRMTITSETSLPELEAHISGFTSFARGITEALRS